MKLESLDKAYVLQTYARNYTEFVSGNNATLKDNKGKKYIDFGSGIGVVSVGHGNRALTKAISKQASKLIHLSNLYAIRPQAELAEQISLHSGVIYHSFFANSGAEANEGAIKCARKYGEVNGETKRYKVVTLNHSFHGRTITALKATGQEAMHTYFGPFPDGFVYAESIDDIYNKLDDHTVAVMIELVQGEGGVEPLAKKAVQKLAQELKKKDILLIVDEVQTGIYRTGEFLASNYYGIEPDIITLAKGLGGGVPIGVVMSKKKDMLTTGEHGSTFGGNLLSTTAGLSVLKTLKKEYHSGKLGERTSYFNSSLEKFYQAHTNLFGKMVGVGMMRGLRLNEGVSLTDVITAAHKHGVVVLKAGRNTLRFLPPLTITKKEIDQGFKRLNKAMKELA
jgi:acetylornithine/N-succinyldiaminopimelate aminotransferase